MRELDAIRGMKLEYGDDKIFWFRDDLHNPCPVSPFAMSTIQIAHQMGYALAAEEAMLPGSRGASVKTHHNRAYLGFVGITDPEIIKERASHFFPFIEKNSDNWDVFYGNAVKEAECITVPNARKDLSELSYGKLANHLKKCQAVNIKCLYLHFLTMYVAASTYMMGEQFVLKYGMTEQEYTELLGGFVTKGLLSDHGQFELTKAAIVSEDVSKLMKSDESIEVIIEKIKQTEDGKKWWNKLEIYLNEFGHRTAISFDIIYPSWYEDPAPVVQNIQKLLNQVENGWDSYVEHDKTIKNREQAIERLRLKLDPKDREAFEKGLPKWQKGYAYNEDHWFYMEQMNFISLRYAAMEVGRRFAKLGILQNVQDVFKLTISEVIETLNALDEHNENVVTYIYSKLIGSVVAYRAVQLREAEENKGPAFLGAVPEKIEDPICMKVFGLTDATLELAKMQMAGTSVVSDVIKGFPASAGVVEGPACVITDESAFSSLESGSILVCAFTSTAWTPIFPKIKGIVTDSGGMLTHAAIAAREYGLPAVVGTWVGTTSINTGDIIRINGSEGYVEIISRKK